MNTITEAYRPPVAEKIGKRIAIQLFKQISIPASMAWDSKGRFVVRFSPLGKLDKRSAERFRRMPEPLLAREGFERTPKKGRRPAPMVNKSLRLQALSTVGSRGDTDSWLQIAIWSTFESVPMISLSAMHRGEDIGASLPALLEGLKADISESRERLLSQRYKKTVDSWVKHSHQGLRALGFKKMRPYKTGIDVMFGRFEKWNVKDAKELTFAAADVVEAAAKKARLGKITRDVHIDESGTGTGQKFYSIGLMAHVKGSSLGDINADVDGYFGSGPNTRFVSVTFEVID